MRLALALFAAAAACAAPRPVLLELFTSEGCSSCPPADTLLASLLAGQPFADVTLIGLSEHVDYWNSLGWADPFSSPRFSERQQRYALRFAAQGPYTPQLVIDGRAEALGSDARAIAAAVTRAARAPKLPLTLADPRRDGAAIRVRVELPEGAPAAGRLELALTEAAVSVAVPRGENVGRTLHHAAVTRAFLTAARLKRGAPWRGEVVLPIPPGVRAPLSVVAFLQLASGEVAALATAPVPPAP